MKKQVKLNNVCIFGSSGSLGEAFLRRISNSCKDLLVVSRSSTKLIDDNLKKNNCSSLELDYPINSKDFTLAFNKYYQNKKIDLVINCIGYYEPSKDIFDQDVFNRNMLSNFHVLQFITKVIKKTIKKDGKFINISSIASNHGAHDEFAYSASKKIVDYFLEVYNQEYSNKFEIINISPGAIISKITSGRKNSKKLIIPEELVDLALHIAYSGKSLAIPAINVFKKEY